MSALRRRTVILLMALLSALVLSTGGLVWAEDTPHEIRDRQPRCCSFDLSPDPPCYLCNGTRP